MNQILNHISCSECGKYAIGPVDLSKIIIRAWIICPECLEKVPKETFDKFIQEIHKKD